MYIINNLLAAESHHDPILAKSGNSKKTVELSGNHSIIVGETLFRLTFVEICAANDSESGVFKMVTIKQIAAELDVSPTTVSNVIHGNTKEVSPQTIQRVREKIEELQYIPNMNARSLARSSSKIIGLIIRYPTMEGKNVVQDPFNSELIGVIENEVRKLGYYLMLYASDKADEIQKMAITWNVDGIISLGLNASECRKMKENLKIPLVFIDCYFQDDDESYTNVGLKDRECAKRITEYLIGMGHKKIAFLADNRVGVDYERWQGYREALEEHHIPVPKNEFFQIGFGTAGIIKTYDIVCQRIGEFTALFFASDYYASFAVNYFYDRGIRVPEDISVVGFDDNIFARNTRPRLTTMRQNPSKKGRTAVAQVLRLINNESIPVHNIRLDAELVIRDSVKDISK